MKDLKKPKYFLGLEVLKGIFLLQQKYALDIVASAGLLGIKPINFPMGKNYCLIKEHY